MTIGIRIAALLIGAMIAGKPCEAQVTTLNWSSTGAQGKEISQEIAELYLTLYNSGNLAVREAKLGDAKYVESLLRQEQVFFGPYLPLSVDAMLCDLNSPKICKREKIPSTEAELANPFSHVGGFKPSRGQWSASADDLVKIPGYDFKLVTTLGRIEVPADWSPGDFKPDPAMDCSSWKMNCEEVVEVFNPPLINAPKSGFQATVPQLQIEAIVPVKIDDKSQYADTLKRGTEPTASSNEISTKFEKIQSPVWTEKLGQQSSTDFTVKAIRNRLKPFGMINKYGTPTDALFEDEKPLLQLIHHPFAETDTLPPSLTNPVEIVVIDSEVTERHCDLPIIRRADGTEISAIDIDDCDKIDELARSDADHAIHVAGLIASQPNDKGVVGLNPFAKLTFLEFDKAQSAEDQLASLQQQVLTEIPRNARVVNLSFGFPTPAIGSDEIIKNAFNVQAGRILLVAAAGNNSETFDANHCRVLPACLNGLDNVMTVVGLDRNLDSPRPWRSQTSGTNVSPKFDIGAIADNVLSTVSGNSYAHFSGTSQAAPQVTATASMVFGAGEFIWGRDLEGGRLAPKIVKDRLNYTADFFSGIGSSVFSGRLNVKRAVELANAQFILFDGREITGQVVEAPDSFACRAPGPERIQNWWDIRRLSFNNATNKHIIFRNQADPDNRGSRYGNLERLSSCLVDTETPVIKVRVRNGSEFATETFSFGEIRDYTSPLFD